METADESVKTIKSDLKVGLIAIGLAALGGLLLLGAAALFLLPILDGDQPNLVGALALGIPGAIIEIIGDWKLMKLRFAAMDRKIAKLKSK